MKTLILFISLFITSVDFNLSHIKIAENIEKKFLTLEESETEYVISAVYDVAKNKKVESVLNDYLKQGDDPSFRNTKLDADLTLSDKTNFYIKFYPGRLLIKFNKQKNTSKALFRFKEMGRELKRFL